MGRMDDVPRQRKVFVSRRAQEDGVRPAYVYHEAPDAPWDSGWRAVVGDESPADADDPASIVLASVAEMIERWPELRPVLASPEADGTWGWDPGAREYVPVPDA